MQELFWLLVLIVCLNIIVMQVVMIVMERKMRSWGRNLDALRNNEGERFAYDMVVVCLKHIVIVPLLIGLLWLLYQVRGETSAEDNTLWYGIIIGGIIAEMILFAVLSKNWPIIRGKKP